MLTVLLILLNPFLFIAIFHFAETVFILVVIVIPIF